MFANFENNVNKIKRKVCVPYEITTVYLLFIWPNRFHKSKLLILNRITSQKLIKSFPITPLNMYPKYLKIFVNV